MNFSPSLENEPVEIIINGRPYPADPKMTVLESLKSHNFDIPTLCFHPALKPSGACRLCAVEVAAKSGKTITMLSCILPVKNGLEIKTQGELVKQARIRAFGNLIQMAPQSRKIRDLAKKHGIDLGPPPDGCIRCRLCVRVCREIVGPGALVLWCPYLTHVSDVEHVPTFVLLRSSKSKIWKVSARYRSVMKLSGVILWKIAKVAGNDLSHPNF
jgi:predicted molibdopterin-dependent oxidoreductase YjgC